nr:hypothetical protein [Tanacetum cinerariifolium]GEW09123.1 hypothetical protein [Tanacetum cinerariifolium]
MVEYSQKWHNETSSKARSTKTPDGLAAIQAQLNNLKKEIKRVSEKLYAAQYRAAGPGFYQRENKNSSYPDRRQTLEESLTKFMAKSAKRHEENSNIIKEIQASTDAEIRNQGASIKTLEIQIGHMSKNKDDHEGKSPAGTLIDIPVFVGKFSVLAGFIIIDDVTRDVVPDTPYGISNPSGYGVWMCLDVISLKLTIWHTLKKKCAELVRSILKPRQHTLFPQELKLDNHLA